jgi:hypothetical protein
MEIQSQGKVRKSCWGKVEKKSGKVSTMARKYKYDKSNKQKQRNNDYSMEYKAWNYMFTAQ